MAGEHRLSHIAPTSRIGWITAICGCGWKTTPYQSSGLAESMVGAHVEQERAREMWIEASMILSRSRDPACVVDTRSPRLGGGHGPRARAEQDLPERGSDLFSTASDRCRRRRRPTPPADRGAALPRRVPSGGRGVLVSRRHSSHCRGATSGRGHRRPGRPVQPAQGVELIHDLKP